MPPLFSASNAVKMLAPAVNIGYNLRKECEE